MLNRHRTLIGIIFPPGPVIHPV